MDWLCVTIQTSSAGVELVAANLTLWGFDSLVIDDQAEFQEFLEQNTAYWDYVDENLAKKMEGVSQITLYLENKPSAPETIRLLQEQLSGLQKTCPDLPLGSLILRVNDLPDEDWANSWRKNYPPIPVGRNILVTPHWLEPDNPEGRILLRLEPGLTFGTGAHASTQLCMGLLEDVVHGGERMIDLGSGSGILSIAALLLGAKTAIGVDIDPKSEDIARENAQLNGLGSDRFCARTCDILTDTAAMRELSQGGYDVVCANIVADVIIPMTRIVSNFLRPNSRLICSGILNSRAKDVEAAFAAAGLQVLRRETMGEWCAYCTAMQCKEESPCA